MRGRVLSGWVAAMMFFGPGEAAAAPVWVGDMESGDLSQWGYLLNEEVGGVKYTTVTSDPVVQGTYAARIELHNDATWPNGLKRVEVQHGPEASRTAEGATLFFAWSFYLPETLAQEPSQQIGYWESGGSYQQMMAFEVTGERITFSTRRPQNVVQWDQDGIVTAGVWHRIAMRITWSKDPAIGAVDVWFDGEQVVTNALAQTLADDNPHFTQMGLLRGKVEFDDVPVIIIDDAVEGDSVEDVHPELESPEGSTSGGGESSGGDDTSSSGGGEVTTGDTSGTGDGSSGGAPTGGETTGTSTTDAGGTSSAGSETGSGASETGTAPQDDKGSGCGCDAGGSGALAWFGLLALGRRRRALR
jgi:hypothetical protein